MGSDATASPGEGTGPNAQTSTPAAAPPNCDQPQPGRAPLRRLTRFEYNRSVDALLGDDSSPGNSLPPELLGNGYGNDADEQPTSSLLAEQFSVVAADIAQRMASDPSAIASTCTDTASPAGQQACAQGVLDEFVAKAYRRPLTADEAQELLELQSTVAGLTNFEDSIVAMVEVVLQSPDFLYRLEFGVPDPNNSGLRRPSGYEMATRLSYLFWGSTPDDELMAAAESGALMTADGVRSQATRLLGDTKALPVIDHFFDHFLPINTLTDLSRDAEQFPTFSPTIGGLMRQETHKFLQYEIFEGPGDYVSVLTAPYTFVNETLADFYGIPGVTGSDFRRVDYPNPDQRKGLLTQGAIQTGTTISNFTNPVRRGVFLLRSFMCVALPPPPESIAGTVMPPDPYSAATGRERYSIHSTQPECAACHAIMDPPGFGLENYDAVGLWRDQENGVTIDASGDLAVIGGAFSGPMDMVDLIANNEQTHACFAENWANYAYGRTLNSGDACTTYQLEQAFTTSGYNIKELLVALTQADAFLYLPAQETL
jgi:hypothetical protein